MQPAEHALTQLGWWARSHSCWLRGGAEDAGADLSSQRAAVWPYKAPRDPLLKRGSRGGMNRPTLTRPLPRHDPHAPATPWRWRDVALAGAVDVVAT
jgi:hypothetical protein